MLKDNIKVSYINIFRTLCVSIQYLVYYYYIYIKQEMIIIVIYTVYMMFRHPHRFIK